jgi:FlaA1/EpsC-like NDP-sugar epimerase
LFGILFNFAGLSIAIGAFAAGLVISPSIYKFEILSRIKPIRDFFSTIFFVSLGLIVSRDINNWPTIILLIVFVTIIKPIIIMLLSFFAGYRKRTSFLVSTFLAQASEFSLIIAISAYSFGYIDQNILNIAAIVSIVSIVVSSYFSSFDERLYMFIGKYLKFFELKKPNQELIIEKNQQKDLRDHVVLIGADRVGSEIAQTLQKRGNIFVVVDYNPTVIKKLKKERIRTLFGDITDAEILDKASIEKSKMIINTIPNFETNMLLLKKTKLMGRHPVIYLTAQTVDDALKLYESGADYVIIPQLLGGTHISSMIKETANQWEKFLEYKQQHLKDLKKRKKDEEVFI